MRGPHFFKYAAQNMQGLPDFVIPAFSLQKSHIYLSRKMKKCCVYFTQEQPFPPVAMGTLWSDVITRRERHRKPRDEGKMKRFHLPTKISAKDRAKQFPGLLHDSGGKLFCSPGNCVLDHRRKSTLENHFAAAKHARRVKEMDRSEERRVGKECRL